MKLSIHDESQGYTISAYAEGTFTVKGQVLNGSQIIYPELPPKAWDAASIDELKSDHLPDIYSDNVEVIIIGTGKELVFPEEDAMELLYRASVGFEIMDTPAACRTYNILVSEGRNIVAALIAL